MTQRDIKLLWGRAGARCGICRLQLAHDKAHATGAFHVGEHAHIVAEESTGPRGASLLSPEERDAYPNRILLCPTCHETIDFGNPEAYPIEKLYQIKANHELWVQSQLSVATDRQQADAQVYAGLVDAAAEGLNFDHWDAWVSNALSPYQFWSLKRPDGIEAYRVRIVRAVWPGTLTELEAALTTLAIAGHQAAHTFLQHAVPERDRLMAERFYKLRNYDQQEYQRLLGQFNRWQKRCYWWLYEATKAANWLADVVRRDLNPLFFAVEGRFAIAEDDVSSATKVLTYSPEELAQRPKALSERVLREHRRGRT